MNLRFNKFYATEGGGASIPDATGTSEDLDTLELLNVEDDEVKEEPLDLDDDAELPTDRENAVDIDPDEEDPLKEIEEEIKLPSEEDLELTTPVRRKEILAKYPTLFKDFPYLEKAYYREQQFTEVFPTIQDARISAEKAQILDAAEKQVMNGDITMFLQAAKAENDEAFNKIADNYLPTLRKVDQQAYYHVLGNVIKDTIITMVREGRNLGDQGAPLTAAANVLNQFIFGSQKFTPPGRLSTPVDPQVVQARQEIQQNQQRQVMHTFTNVRDDLQTRADNVLRSTIDGHIDPNKTMTEYVKEHATKEAFDKLEDLIGQDTRFRGMLDKLWERAFKSGFDKESTDRIKSAYLSKAKTLLPSVIKSARNKALRERSDSNQDLMASKKGPIARGSTPRPSSGKFRKAADIPHGMSTLDVLMKD
jgi:hypothetical protein